MILTAIIPKLQYVWATNASYGIPNLQLPTLCLIEQGTGRKNPHNPQENLQVLLAIGTRLCLQVCYSMGSAVPLRK